MPLSFRYVCTCSCSVYMFSEGIHLTLTTSLMRWGYFRLMLCCYKLQAAKTDPFNPDIFLLLGHYQRQITKDLK